MEGVLSFLPLSVSSFTFSSLFPLLPSHLQLPQFPFFFGLHG